MTKKRRLSPEEIAAGKERANAKRRFRRLWAGDLTTEEICEELGWTIEAVHDFATALGLGERVEPDVYIPTEVEIRLAAAQIRMRWTPAEREARMAPKWSGTLEDATQRDNYAGRGTSRRRGEGGQAHPEEG